MTKLVKKINNPFFSKQELQELNKYINSDKPHNIAPAKAEQFFILFLEGRTIDQIHKAHPQWPKGALLLARHEYEWDKQKEEYLTKLFENVRSRMLKLKAEVANHIMDKLAVAHKEFARDMEQYLINPNSANIPKNRLRTMREYKDAILILKELLNMGKEDTDDPLKKSSLQGASITINVNTTDKNNVETKIISNPNDAKQNIKQLNKSSPDVDNIKNNTNSNDVIDVKTESVKNNITSEEQKIILNELLKLKNPKSPEDSNGS